MQLKYKLIENGISPSKATIDAACFDLFLPDDIVLYAGGYQYTPLKIAFDIPRGYYIEVYPRSSLLAKHGVISPVSIIDEDYKSGIHAILCNICDYKVGFKRGDRLLQFMLKQRIDYCLEHVQEIEDTGRGGLGSTGV